MNCLVTYGSSYNSSKLYAEEFSKNMGFDLISYKDAKNLDGYDTIIHFGGLYAGKVKGLKEVYSKKQDKTKFVVVAVGLADSKLDKTKEDIKTCIKKYIPENEIENIKIFYLRGAMDYKKLGFTHKMMMNFMYKHLEGLPEEEKTDEVIAVLNTKENPVNFVDFNNLKEIKDFLNNENK